MEENENFEDELERLLQSEREREKEKKINAKENDYLNEIEKKKNYISKVEKILGKLPKSKIVKAIQADYNNKKISEDTYIEIMKILGERAMFQAELQEDIIYASKEEAEQKLGIKIEGHKIDQIKEIEQEK